MRFRNRKRRGPWWQGREGGRGRIESEDGGRGWVEGKDGGRGWVEGEDRGGGWTEGENEGRGRIEGRVMGGGLGQREGVGVLTRMERVCQASELM